MTRWTEAEYRDRLSKLAKKPAKYWNVKVIVDNITFDSKKEAARYRELKHLQLAREIAELKVQPRFELWACVMTDDDPDVEKHAILVGDYVADFQYRRLKPTREMVVEDVKSPATRTPLYRLKKRIVEACYGISITEV